MMKKARQSIFFSAMLVTVCALLTVCAAALRAGDVVDYVLATDIRAFIDGYEIPAYNISGKLGIVAEDLNAYGFRTSYDNSTRTLKVVRAADRAVTGVSVPAHSGKRNGTRLMPVLYTDIVTYVNGSAVNGYNIDGRTIIFFSELDIFGSRLYDDGARLSVLTTKGTLPAAVTLVGEFPKKIIHAGGEVDGIAGSNSLEALEQSYAAGYRFMEMDFLLSSDGYPVCLHDWSNYYSSELGSTPITLSAFSKIRIFNRYTSMYIDNLAEWLNAHTDVYLITDVKDDNIGVLTVIAKTHPEIVPRLLPQIYSREEYASVRALGYSNIIFTLYRLPSYTEKANAKSLAAFAADNHLFAVTADATLASASYVKTFTDAGVKLFVHTVNGAEEQQHYYDLGVSCIYTDYAK